MRARGISFYVRVMFSTSFRLKFQLFLVGARGYVDCRVVSVESPRRRITASW